MPEKQKRRRLAWLWERAGDASTASDIFSWISGVPGWIATGAAVIGPLLGSLAVPIPDALGVAIVALLTGSSALFVLWVIGSAIHARQVPVLETKLVESSKAEIEPHFYRPAIELGHIASLVAAKEPSTPMLEATLYALLRDAANDGRLDMADKEKRGNYDESSQTRPAELLAYVKSYDEARPFSAFANKWRAHASPRHVVAKLGPGRFTLKGADLVGPSFVRQILVVDVQVALFVAAERRLRVILRGFNSSSHVMFEGNIKGAFQVVASGILIDRTGRPSLYKMLREPRSGTHPRGIPPEVGFEASVDALMPQPLADRIEEEFAAGRRITLDLSEFEFCVYPDAHSEVEKPLSMPWKSLSIARLPDGSLATFKNQELVQTARLESTSKLYSPGVAVRVPLRDAASKLYAAVIDTKLGKQARDLWATEDQILQHMAEVLLHFDAPIFGRRPPSPEIERVALSKADNRYLHVADGGLTLRDRATPPKLHWTDLSIAPDDLDRIIEEIKHHPSNAE